MNIGIGDKIKSNFTGKLFKVKSIMDGLAVLEQEGGMSQVLTDKANLNLFYEKVEDRRMVKDFITSIFTDRLDTPIS
jgi:uncharacterized protein YllA (UPF0747 family)